MKLRCLWCAILSTVLAAVALLATTTQGQEPKPSGPLSPEESLRGLVLADQNLQVELVACEPRIVDPVEARFDEDGRLWVVEMRDYPDPPAPGESPKSRVKLLYDRDGDGHYEESHVFAEGLLFATGLQPWKGGVIVTVSGKILYLKDTDGDHRADVNETWFTGFAEENPQLRVNHPRFALDNHVYVASGLRTSTVLATRQPDAPPVQLRGRDMRFDPLGTTAEAVSGNGQFGLTFGDWGQRFLCSNRNPLMHVVMEDRYARRNPNFALPAVVHDVAAAGEASRVYPLSEAWTTSHLHAGQFTAACGVHIYRGDALTARFRGNAFTCEPTGNLVHREVLSPSGATFRSESPYKEREFLASRDTWFRPVNLETGPDGALYVVDIYRAVIEHPQFMPEELKRRPDLRYGDDRGRIYRITLKDWQRPQQRPALSKLATTDLLPYFASPNAWWREAAARLIYERQDRSDKLDLTQFAIGQVYVPGSTAEALSRVHAFWALDGIKCLDDELLWRGMQRNSWEVLEQLLILAEPRCAKPGPLHDAVKPCEGGGSDHFDFQMALTLGAIPDCDADVAERLLAAVHMDDPWSRRAVQASLADRGPLMIARLIERLNATTLDELLNVTSREWRETLLFLQEVGTILGSRNDLAELGTCFARLAKLTHPAYASGFRAALLSGIARGLRARGKSLAAIAKQNEGEYPDMARIVQAAFLTAVERAADPRANEWSRLDAIELLGYTDFATAGEALLELVKGDSAQAIKLKAVAALASFRDPSIAAALVDQLPKQTPALRGAMLDALLAQADRVNLLLDAIESGRAKATDLDPARAARLAKHSDASIRARAAKLLASALPADRTAALEKYKPALALNADARHGKEVFRKNCSTCHKIDDVGVDVGPSIGDARTKTLEQLLIDILQPSRAIDNNFMSYVCVTDDGLSYTGIVVSETATSVTMKLPEAKTVSLLRSNIEELRSTGLSLMPEGLERQLSLQDMADVIAFVKNWRYLSGNVPVAAP